MNDALEWACENAVKGPSAPRWEGIWSRAVSLSPSELDRLDEALRAWPDAMREADETALEGGSPLPELRIARRLRHRQGPLDGTALHDLLAHPDAARLSSLALFSVDTQLSAIEALASDPSGRPQLVELQLACMPIQDEASEVLGRSPLAVRILTFERGATDRSPATIARGEGLPRLEHLQYHDVQVGDAGLAAIAASARMAALSYLRISYSDVGADGARALAASRAPKLDGLDLRLTRVGEEGMAALAGSEALRRVSGLHLSEARLGAAGVRALAEHFRGERLEQLDLAHNRSARRLSPDWQVGPDACSALVSARFMQTVRSLDLAGNALGADGARAVATSPRLGSLRVLDLTMNAIGDAGVEALLSSGLVHRLDRLRLQHDDTIGEEAFDALIDTCEAHGVELEL